MLYTPSKNSLYFIYTRIPSIDFFSTTACSHILLLVSQSSNLTFSTQGFNIWHKLITMWKALWGLSRWETHNNAMTSKIALAYIKVFLDDEWHSFHLLGKKLDCLHLHNFLRYECELYLRITIGIITMQDHCCWLHHKPNVQL